jgi:hypothetical protein
MTGSATPADTLQEQNESTISQVLSSVVLIQTASDLGSGVVFDDKEASSPTTTSSATPPRSP